jgi:restriction system protein
MVKTPLFPSYHQVQKLIKVLSGRNEADFKSMWSTIWNLRGTPQEPVDWQDPDEWIQKRLTDLDKKTALSIWNETEHIVNPRHIRGLQMIINGYSLLAIEKGVYKLTDRGQIFISSADNVIINEIDVEEGCVFNLYLCSIHPKSTRKAFLKEWEEYLKANSNYRKESVIKDSLRRRLTNLRERKLISRVGNIYSLTRLGEKYLARFGETQLPTRNLPEEAELNKHVDSFNDKQKNILREKLHQLTPTQFEELVKELLDAMGYEDVRVTSPTNDKGVDVVGVIQNGITSVTEVIQVKRFSANVQRPVLDSLRGCLHRFDAFQGTIITLSDFSKGTKEAAFERGAAPITLINGDKLIELLVANDITVKSKTLKYFSVDLDYFIESKEQEEQVE